MIKKALRTRDKYAKAAAELDILDKCLLKMKNVHSLIPANEIDKILYLRDKVIAKYKCFLERQAAKDFAVNVRFDEFPVSEIYFKWDREKDEDYKCGINEMKTAIFGEDGEQNENN
jgi:hypothetical protein